MVARLLERMREFGFYGAASAIALAVDVGLLELLTSVLHIHYLVAATVSFVSGGVVLYALSVTFVFRARALDNRTLEISFFLALGVIGLIVNGVVIHVAVSAWHAPVLAGKLVAAGFTFCANFLLRRLLLFSPVQRPRAT